MGNVASSQHTLMPLSFVKGDINMNSFIPLPGPQTFAPIKSTSQYDTASSWNELYL